MLPASRYSSSRSSEPARVAFVRELHAMSGALVVILALSLIRLRIANAILGARAPARTALDSNRSELMFLRLASQGIGYLTVLGPAASEPMKIKLLEHHHGSATAATLVDTGAYWMSAGLVLIAGSICSHGSCLRDDRGAFDSSRGARRRRVCTFSPSRRRFWARLSRGLENAAPGWLMKAAQIEGKIRRFAATHPATIRRMFVLDLACQALLLAEVAVALYFFTSARFAPGQCCRSRRPAARCRMLGRLDACADWSRRGRSGGGLRGFRLSRRCRPGIGLGAPVPRHARLA